MNIEEREHLKALLNTYKQRLHHLELQAAIHGIDAPPHLLMDLEDSRQNISRLRKQLVQLSADPTLPIQAETVSLVQTWQNALDVQRSAINKHKVTPALHEFVTELCRQLDFILVPNSYHTHHGHCVACLVQTPTIHLRLPNEIPLILLLEEDASNDVIERLPDVPKMMGASMNFGLILAPGSHSRVQQRVNKLLRPAMKTDLIVLGYRFLDEIDQSTSPRTALLREILREVDLIRVSPFMAGGADLSDRMFFGREGEIKTIAESITQTSVAITCGRRMGKTTLLNRLARVVLPARNHTCFFLNCQPVRNYHDFLREMTTIWQRADIPFDPDQPNSFSQVVDRLRGANGEPPIFLLDEVDELLRFDAEHHQQLFIQFRALSMDGRARFIMTGERSVQKHLRDADSPLFNFFGVKLKLSFLDWSSVNKLILEPLNDLQIELSDPMICSRVFDATSGHPYLVQRLCQGIVQAISRRQVRIVDLEHVETALNDPAYQDDYFETVWGQAPALARVITMLIGSDGVTMKEIQQMLSHYNLTPTLREINAALEVLDLYSVLERKSGRYHFVATALPEMRLRAYGDDLNTNIELLCEEYRWQQTSSTLAH
jgi:hypothetical protein